MTSNSKKKSYRFRGKVWKYKGKSGWYFITLPKGISREIRKCYGLNEEGWGRLKTLASIGRSEWKTAIWYDSKVGAYLLPLKSLIRKKELIFEDSQNEVTLLFENSKSIW